MEKIAFYTQTYCGEKYVRRAIESVLNQTYQNLVYYISDDGSTDSTPEIIMEYANKDSRIVPYLSKSNDTMKLYSESLEKIWSESGAKYFAILDHDDEYALSFAEKMISAIEKIDAQWVACGSHFLDFETGRLVNDRCTLQSFIVDKSNKAALFPLLFQFYRTLWGKVYKIEFLVKNHIQFRNNVNYGLDTLFLLDCSSKADCFIVLQDILHSYYISNSSISHHFDPKREDDDEMLYKEGIAYLERIKGASLNNTNFLLCVYLEAVLDCISLIFNSTLSLNKMVESFRNVLSRKVFCENWNELQIRCKTILDKENYIWKIKKKFQQEMQIIKEIIKVNAKYSNHIFYIFCVFCPEFSDFFDSTNMKSFLALDTISNAFFCRDFESAYEAANLIYSSKNSANNKLVYNVIVYLSVILHKENYIIQEYMDNAGKKKDALSQKRIQFISKYIETGEELKEIIAEKTVVTQKEDVASVLLQMDKLAELYETIGESITYIMNELEKGNLNRVEEMLPILQSGLEHELSFVKHLQNRNSEA